MANQNSTLKAVLFLDLVNSSQLMSANEAGTISFLHDAFSAFSSCADNHSGEVIKTTGDGALMLFDSAMQAINCAWNIHEQVAELPHTLSQRPGFRSGIHVGEVIERGGDVFGHAVNLSSRLETVAHLGEICVSAEVYALVRHSETYEFEALGGYRLKNMPAQTPVYRVIRQTQKQAHSNTPKLRIDTIGGLRLESPATGGVLVTQDMRFTALGYLALSPDTTEEVGRLCALFWPDRTAAQAKSALTRLLNTVNQTHGPICFRRPLAAGLDTQAISVDLKQMEQQLRLGFIDDLLLRTADWPDQILAGTESTSTLYASWLKVTRSDWRLRIAQVLELCLDRYETGDDQMRDAALALLRIEPGHERAARNLMAHYHDVDNPGAAMRVYQDLTAALSRLYGLSPKDQTRMIAQGGKANVIENKRPRVSPAPLRIQVVQFDAARTETAAQLYSFRSEILASLAKFRGWMVAEGIQPSLGENETPDYRLSAHENSFEGRAEVTLTLAQMPNHRVVWSSTVVLNPETLLDAQKTAVASISAALEVYVSTDRTSGNLRAEEHGVVDEWLRAEQLRLSEWTPQAHARAAAVHKSLVERAPSFAPAYASLAGILNVGHIVNPGATTDDSARQLAYDTAETAAELDPLDARNQMVVGWSAALEGDFDKASIHMEMAARLNPNSPRTLVSCALAFAFLGEHDRAQAALDHSLACSPLLRGYQWCYAASIYFLAGDLDQALRAAKRGRNAIIDNDGWKAAILQEMGRADDARVAFDRLVASVSPVWSGALPATPDTVGNWFETAYPLRRAEDRARLRLATLY